MQVGELFFRGRWMDLIGTEIIAGQDGDGMTLQFRGFEGKGVTFRGKGCGDDETEVGARTG